jgi:multiple sugar transport system permease protein
MRIKSSVKLSLRQKREVWFYLIVTPWLLGFLLLHFLPALGTLLLSLLQWELPRAPEFVGLKNFARMFSDPSFIKALLNSAYFALATVPLSIGLGMVLALLTKPFTRGVRFLRSVFLLPAVVPGVAAALTWGWVFNPRYGLVNTMLSILGIEGPTWLFDPALAMPVVILIHLWTAGINMFVYLAAMQNLPAELYEAARIDGANAHQRFLKLTWPLLAPITLYLAIINLIGSFQAFTPVYILTGGGPNNATLTLPLYIYQSAFQWGDLGYAASVASTMLCLVLGLAILLVRSATRSVYTIG